MAPHRYILATILCIGVILGIAIGAMVALHRPIPYSHAYYAAPSKHLGMAVTANALEAAEASTFHMFGTYKLDKETDFNQVVEDELSAGLIHSDKAERFIQENTKLPPNQKLHIKIFGETANHVKYPIATSDEIEQDAGSTEPKVLLNYYGLHD